MIVTFPHSVEEEIKEKVEEIILKKQHADSLWIHQGHHRFRLYDKRIKSPYLILVLFVEIYLLLEEVRNFQVLLRQYAHINAFYFSLFAFGKWQNRFLDVFLSIFALIV